MEAVTDHTPACEKVRAGHVHEGRPDPWPKMGSLSVEEQEAVLACPHWAHDSIRSFFKGGRAEPS